MKFVKFLHVLLNVIFLLGGIALIGAGIWALVAQNVPGLGNLSNLRLLAIGTICLGSFILFVSLLGCCGASRESRGCLGAYAIIVGLLVAGQITVTVLAITHRSTVVANLPVEWTNMQKDPTGMGWETIEAIEAAFKCCAWCVVCGVANSPRAHPDDFFCFLP